MTAGRTPKPKKPRKAKETKVNFTSVETWERKSAGGWVGGQSKGVTPGSTGAVTKRQSGKKYKALGAKVIRPRINKQNRPKEK